MARATQLQPTALPGPKRTVTANTLADIFRAVVVKKARFETVAQRKAVFHVTAVVKKAEFGS